MTCGNNSFVSLNIWGTYTLAPFVNIGSETTNYYGCYFGQLSTDPAAYAYVGDGYNAKGAMITSLYTSLRGVNDAVSFTNNKFYGCHFRNEGVGSSVFLSCTNNWEMDPCCYFLAFGKSNIEIYQGTTGRNGFLKINGLYESSQGGGVDDLITFIVPDGVATGIAGLSLSIPVYAGSNSVMKVVNLTGGVTTGTLAITQFDFKMGGRSSILDTLKFVDVASGKRLSLEGSISIKDSDMLNLYDCKQFLGTIYTDDAAAISGTAGTDLFNYSMVSKGIYAGQVAVVASGSAAWLGVQNLSYPILRGEGTDTDVDIALKGKGAGYVRFGTRTSSTDVPVTGYIEIKDIGGVVRKLAVIG